MKIILGNKLNCLLVLSFILILLGVILHFFDLAGQSAWWDEGLTLDFLAYDSFSSFATSLLSSNSSWSLQPAYYFILYPWLLIFGPSLTALRALSAIFGSLSVVVLMYGSWRTWGLQWTCLTGFFAAWSGYGIWYSQEIRPYSLSFLAVSLVLTCYLCFRSAVTETQIRRWRLCLAIFAMLCVWVNVLNVLFLVVLALFDFLFHRSFKAWLGLWAPAALASATFAAWLVPHFVLMSDSQGIPTADAPIPALLQAGFIASALAVGRTYGPPLVDLRGSNAVDIALQYWPHFIILGIALLAIAISVALILREDNHLSEPSLKLVFVLSGTLIVLFLFFWLVDAFGITKIRPRYMFSLWPLMALILPAVIYHQPHTRAPKRRLVGCVAVLALLVLNFSSVFNYFNDPKHGRDNYRFVAEYISEHGNTLPVLVHGNKTTFSFHTDRTLVDAREFLPDDLQALREITGNASKVVFIINRPFDYRPDAKAYLAQVLGPEFKLADEISPHYFKMYLFERVDSREP